MNQLNPVKPEGRRMSETFGQIMIGHNGIGRHLFVIISAILLQFISGVFVISTEDSKLHEIIGLLSQTVAGVAFLFASARQIAPVLALVILICGAVLINKILPGMVQSTPMLVLTLLTLLGGLINVAYKPKD